MRAIVYIDGFNLYYRLLKKNPQHKWLNPYALARHILDPKFDIVQVNYYTARVSARTYDPDAPARQAVYLNALATEPLIKVHEGNFLARDTWMPLANPADARPSPYVWSKPEPELVKVVKTEEKGSDVNLASHLVRDAFTNAFDAAFIITNDSDLVEPVRIVTQEVGRTVGLLVPVKAPTASLADAASFSLHIRAGHLAKAQFADVINLPNGKTITKPTEWV